MGCTLGGIAQRRLLIELRINAPPVLCIFFLADRTVQEQCCVAVLEDNMCTTGSNMAKEQGSCDTLFTNTCETKTTKVCLCVHVQVCSLFEPD